jgi:hypothetical protein
VWLIKLQKKKNAYRILMGQPEINKGLGRPRHRRVDGTNMDGLMEIRRIIRIRLHWLRIGPVEGCSKRGNEHSGSIKWEIPE